MTDRLPPAAIEAAAGSPVWDGCALLAAVTAATDWLTAHADHVNALNVFPVPDGDTGVNMSLTMQAAVDAARAAEADDPVCRTAGAVAAALADGALMGARGNSGVILSQILRGFARALAGRAALNGHDLAASLTAGSALAYLAVVQPVEGTMLTVARVAAERATAAASEGAALDSVLATALDAAREALAATPDMLDILRRAGVVDAGGQGLVFILEGIVRHVRGLPVPRVMALPADHLAEEMDFLDRIGELHGEDGFGYCTNFMVSGAALDVEQARADLAALGESAVIVGNERVLKVHLHTLQPDLALAYGLRLGELTEIKIDNMQAQTRALQAQRQRPPVWQPPPPIAPVGDQAVLAVASGAGLVEALVGMGATGIVPGGQTMNPSTEELLAAVAAAPVDEIILLPNNPNILLTANQVPGMTPKQVRVVPSRSIPQALAALGVYHAGADLAANVEQMTRALGTVRTVEVTHAVRDATIDGVAVVAGEGIGLVDGHLVASGEGVLVAGTAALARAGLDTAELVTIFAGEGADTGETAALQAHIEASYPDVVVETYDGGQPLYRYVIAVE